MIKAIIFDFDGTIIDTETAWYVAFRDAYRDHGIELTPEKYSGCLGTSLEHFNPYTYIRTHHHVQLDLDEFAQSVRARHSKLMQQEQIRPGILKLLESAKASGLRIGLASSSHRQWVDQYVNQLGLAGYFECIRTADNVKKVKPDPELYLQALEGMGAAPEEAVAIEDSPNGARAAVAAGMHCFVIPNTLTKLLPFGEGHRTLDSLDSIELDSLLASLPLAKP